MWLWHPTSKAMAVSVTDQFQVQPLTMKHVGILRVDTNLNVLTVSGSETTIELNSLEGFHLLDDSACAVLSDGEVIRMDECPLDPRPICMTRLGEKY